MWLNKATDSGSNKLIIQKYKMNENVHPEITVNKAGTFLTENVSALFFHPDEKYFLISKKFVARLYNMMYNIDTVFTNYSVIKQERKVIMNKLVVITGPTASGKSGLGIDLAKKYNAEIISADSRQVFRGLDIGSGKVTPEETQGIPHYLLDVAEPNDFFSVMDFQEQAYRHIDEIHGRNGKAFLVGGTGLYVNSVVDGYNMIKKQIDPETRNEIAAKSLSELITFLEERNPEVLTKIDLKNKRRVERAVERTLLGNTEEPVNTPRYETLVLGTNWPREVLYERIRERLDMRLDMNMIEEVVKLREHGATDEFLYRLGLEYRYILMYLRDEFESFDAFYDKLFMEIRHLAKEQMTWFRKRKDIHWLDMTGDPFTEASELIDEFYSK